MHNAAQTIKATFEEIEGLKQVEYVSGRITVETVKKMAAKAPALLFTFLNVKRFTKTPAGLDATVRMGVYLLTRDARDSDMRRTNRDLDVLLLVDGVVAVITGDGWPLDEPENLVADNLYSSEKMQGIALWGAAWDQEISLGDAVVALADMDEFLTMGLKSEASDADGDPLIEEEIEVRK